MKAFKLLLLVDRYQLKDYLIEWAGILRYLGTRKGGFTIKDWIDLSKAEIDESIALVVMDCFCELDLIKYKDEVYTVVNDPALQETLVTLSNMIKVLPQSVFFDGEKLLWTLPKQYFNVPNHIANNFGYLNTWINNIIQTTNKRLIFLSPYYSVAGISQLMISLNALLSVKNISIDWVVSDYENTDNIRAFELIRKELTNVYNDSKIRFFQPYDEKDNGFSFHAKLLLSDNRKGYIGSANFSKRGLDTQFEIGLTIDSKKTKTLTKLVDFWIEEQVFIQV